MYKEIREYQLAVGDVFEDCDGDLLKIVKVDGQQISYKWLDWPEEPSTFTRPINELDLPAKFVRRQGESANSRETSFADRLNKTVITRTWVDVDNDEAKQILLKHFGLEGGELTQMTGFIRLSKITEV